MSSLEGAALYERLATARISDALIDDAIEMTIEAIPSDVDRAEMASRLCDDDHSAVLRKEVVDVVILVTAAMELPSETLYRDLITAAAPAPFDEATALLKSLLMRRMADAALDEVQVEDRAAVLRHLRCGLSACGDELPYGELAALAA